MHLEIFNGNRIKGTRKVFRHFEDALMMSRTTSGRICFAFNEIFDIIDSQKEIDEETKATYVFVLILAISHLFKMKGSKVLRNMYPEMMGESYKLIEDDALFSMAFVKRLNKDQRDKKVKDKILDDNFEFLIKSIVDHQEYMKADNKSLRRASGIGFAFVVDSLTS